MSFIVIIPARLSSSRLPRKALADIHGKPMVVRVAEQAAKSKASRVIVATDHADIQAACAACGITTVMTADTHESGTTRLAEAAGLLNLPPDTVIVNVQGDEPLIAPELIDRTAEVLVENNVQMATAAHELHDFDEFMNPNVVKVVLDKNRNERLAAGNHRIAGATARPVARLPDCRRNRQRSTRRRCGYAGRFGTCAGSFPDGTERLKPDFPFRGRLKRFPCLKPRFNCVKTMLSDGI